MQTSYRKLQTFNWYYPDWEIVDLNSLCYIITNGSTHNTYEHKYQSDGINFIKVETISQNNEIDINKMSFIDIKCHNDFKRSQLEESDILISIAVALHLLPKFYMHGMIFQDKF